MLAVATLRDPTGRSWHVGLVRHGAAGLRFDGRGWRSFVAGCGLSAGQLLVFDHLGDLDFAVEPFDTSGCSSYFDGERGSTTNIDDDDAAPDVEESGSDNHHHGRSPSRSSLPATTGTKRRKKLSPANASPAGSCGQSSSDDGALRLGIEQPFHLQYMELTKTFCARVGWAESCTAELSVAGRGDRRWEVSGRVGSKGGMIMAGWEGFAWDNGLRISDVCVFRHADTGDQVVQAKC